MKATHIINIAFAGLILGACASSQTAITKAEPKMATTTTVPAVRCPSPTARWKVPIVPRDARSGPDDALVTIVVFNDFQCPFCARVKTTIDQLRQQYEEQVRVVFKHNPLAFHKNARSAAYAAMAAQEQGKFWAMHDLLFEEQRSWRRSTGVVAYDAMAEKIGLDVDQFKRTLADADRRFRSWVDADQQAAHDVQANGTPSFFINGETLVGAQPLAKFQEVIDRQLAVAQCTVDNGASPANLYTTLMQSAKAWSPFDDVAHTFRLEDRPFLGHDNAPITVVVFTDFQCPYCARIKGLLKTLRTRMPGKIRVVIKQYPLSFHKEALPAAKASIAAHQQGRFWSMHDALFAHQTSLTEESIIEFAKTLNLNMTQFLSDFADPTVTAIINEDMADGRRAKLQGTPSLYMNGHRYERMTGDLNVMQRDIERFLVDKQP